MSPSLSQNELMRLSSEELIDRLSQQDVAHPEAVEIQPLTGDASTRRYFRLILNDPTKQNIPSTLMAMQLDEPEEGEMDWLLIQAYLADLNLPVPRIYDYSQRDGLLIIEDLGDVTLEQCLKETGLKSGEVWIDRAVDLLAALQCRATVPKTPAFERRFDVAKLMWEFDFMLEHYAGGLLESPPSDALRLKLREEMTNLCARLEAIEPCYCHRDFHSRNLMVRGDELVMIDFQDARLGPPQYDLASLLRDSYQPLPDEMVKAKIERFLQKKEEMGSPPIDRNAFAVGFDLMAIQRGLKAIGTFAYQKTVKGNARYEPCIAGTLSNVKHSLDQREELSEFKNALEEALPALRSSKGLS